MTNANNKTTAAENVATAYITAVQQQEGLTQELAELTQLTAEAKTELESALLDRDRGDRDETAARVRYAETNQQWCLASQAREQAKARLMQAEQSVFETAKTGDVARVLALTALLIQSEDECVAATDAAEIAVEIFKHANAVHITASRARHEYATIAGKAKDNLRQLQQRVEQTTGSLSRCKESASQHFALLKQTLRSA